MSTGRESEVLKQCASYCSASEHCTSDIKKRLEKSELDENAQKRILDRLMQERFIDDSRYCSAFVRDKIRFNKWGKKRIAFELRKKEIAPPLILETLNDIDPVFYEETLKEILKKKAKALKTQNSKEAFYKLASFASGKGFETDLSIRIASEVLNYNHEEMD
ncbi:MAG: regulatory protein RecX [Bacteroidales bacterium]|nr:regulatory protein RecX [Bacteroidales bacterium]